jgi:glycosyl transferase family 87
MQTQEPAHANRNAPQILARWLVWCYVALLILTMSFWLRFLMKEPSVLAYAWNRDFSSVYVGARAVASGRGFQLYDLGVQRALMDTATMPYHRRNLLPFIYPAYVAVLLAPLGKLPLSTAFVVWTGINLLATAWTAKQLVGYACISPRQRAALLVAFLLWTPLQLTLIEGQFGLVCTLGLTQALISLQSGRPARAGCWLALGLLKPHLLAFPLVALCLWRCWRTICTFLIASAIAFGISFAKLGFWIPRYLRFIANFNSKGPEVSLYPVAMQNWRGLVFLLLGNDSSLAARALLLALSIASLVLLVWVCRRRADTSQGGSSLSSPLSSSLSMHLPRDWQARFGAAIVMGILVSPYLYLHDWVLAAPAFIALFHFAGSLRARAGTALVWLIGLSPFVCFATQFGIWPQSSHIQLVPWYMGLLVVLAVSALGRKGAVKSI